MVGGNEYVVYVHSLDREIMQDILRKGAAVQQKSRGLKTHVYGDPILFAMPALALESNNGCTSVCKQLLLHPRLCTRGSTLIFRVYAQPTPSLGYMLEIENSTETNEAHTARI